MAKIRVFEAAKKTGQDSRALLEALAVIGVKVKSHLSSVDEEAVQRAVVAAQSGKLSMPGIEDRAEDYRYSPEFEREYFALYGKLIDEQFEPALHNLNASLTTLLKSTLTKSQFMRVHIETGRIKGANRALLKARSDKYQTQIQEASQIFQILTDFVGTRITCNTLADVRRNLDVIKKAVAADTTRRTLNKPCDNWIDDYIMNPKESGYRAINVIVGVPVQLGDRFHDVVCEIQIRTLLQHAWGELTHEDTYKPGVRVPELVTKLSKRLATTLAVMDEIAEDIRIELDRTEQQVLESDLAESVQAKSSRKTVEGVETEEAIVQKPKEVRLETESESISSLDALLSFYRDNFIQDEDRELDLAESLRNLLSHQLSELGSVEKEKISEGLKAALAYNDEVNALTEVSLTHYGILNTALDYVSDEDGTRDYILADIEIANHFAQVYTTGAELLGTVVYVQSDYALVQFPQGETGIVHVSTIKRDRFDFISAGDYISEGDTVKVKVISSDYYNKRIELLLVPTDGG